MPIARRPGLVLSYSGVVLQEGTEYEVGMAVAAVRVDGESFFVPCGALLADHPQSFVGFLLSNPGAGSSPMVASVRGSMVTPLVEGDVPLTPGEAVFLSTTAGRVTQTAPLVAGSEIVRVGFALDSTQIIVNNDARYTTPE